MKIRDITLTREKIKLKTPFKTALREVDSAEFIRVKVFCEDGSFAYGEAPATEAITGETLASIEENIKAVSGLFYGRKAKEALKILHLQKIGSSAKAALDIAFVTLLAKEKNRTLREYFDIKDTTPIKTDITISLNDTKTMLREAQSLFAQGMEILKVKLGSDIAHAIETTRQLAQKVPKAQLLIDANQAWSKDKTLEYIQAVKDLDIVLIEQPLKAEALDDLAAVRAQSSIAILADEAVFTLEDAKRVVVKGAADMINVKLMKCGGVSKAIEILEYARAKEIVCMLGSMIEGPTSINITLYLAFAYRDVVKFVDLDSPLLYEALPRELDFCYKADTISFKKKALYLGT